MPHGFVVDAVSRATARKWFFLAVLLGCGGGEAGTPIRSTGAYVVVPGRALELPPVFENVVSIDRLTTGTLIVGDQGLYSVTYLRTDGRITARVGSKGNGPGEFATLRAAHRCLSDTIAVSDFGSGRLSLLTENGYARQIAVPPALLVADLVGCTRDGSALFSRLPDQLPGFGTQWFPITLFDLHLRTGQAEWIGVLRGTEMYVSRTASSFYQQPFGRETLLGATTKGVAVGQTDEPFIRHIDLGRNERRIMLPELKQRAVSEADRRRLLTERLEDEGNAENRRALKRVLSEAEWGERQPRYDRLVADKDGVVWLRIPPGESDTSVVWIRVGRDGRDVAEVRLPARTRIMYVDSELLIGIRTDSSGAQRIVLQEFRLSPSNR